MSYATQQNMIDRFGQKEVIQLTDKATPPTGSINATVLGQALGDADAMINGYVSTRYALPMTDVPQQIVRIACDLARYFLDKKPSEEIKARYDQALAWLRDVSAGRVNLGVSTSQTTPAPSGGPQTTGSTRVFDADTLKDY